MLEMLYSYLCRCWSHVIPSVYWGYGSLSLEGPFEEGGLGQQCRSNPIGGTVCGWGSGVQCVGWTVCVQETLCEQGSVEGQ